MIHETIKEELRKDKNLTALYALGIVEAIISEEYTLAKLKLKILLEAME